MKTCYLNFLHMFHNVLSACSSQFGVCFLAVTAVWVYIGNIPTDGNFLWCSIFLTYWSQNLLCKNVFCHAICLKNFEALPSTWHISMKSEGSDSPEEHSLAQVCPLRTLPWASSVPCLTSAHSSSSSSYDAVSLQCANQSSFFSGHQWHIFPN